MIWDDGWWDDTIWWDIWYEMIWDDVLMWWDEIMIRWWWDEMIVWSLGCSFPLTVLTVDVRRGERRWGWWRPSSMFANDIPIHVLSRPLTIPKLHARRSRHCSDRLLPVTITSLASRLSHHRFHNRHKIRFYDVIHLAASSWRVETVEMRGCCDDAADVLHDGNNISHKKTAAGNWQFGGGTLSATTVCLRLKIWPET